MLRNSFCHVPGIGSKYEQRLWSLGFNTWDSVLNGDASLPTAGRFSSLNRHLERSFLELHDENAVYFSDNLPTEEHWRMFSEFRHSVAYLDIETTGLHTDSNSITTISVYDGHSILCYVQGRNLSAFKNDIEKYRLIVTYNGKCFDVPVIEASFGIRLEAAHIDLRYVLNSLGYLGGLKTCERQFGIDRGDLAGLDGYSAILLWNDFVANQNEKALETLLAYNIEDVVNLETLMVEAYNMKLKQTPFAASHQHSLNTPPRAPFKAHSETVRRIRQAHLLR